MPGIEVLSRTQKIVVNNNRSVRIVNAGPVGPPGLPGIQGPIGLTGPVDPTRVSKSGDTMTGPFILSGNAVSLLEATPLQQVRLLISDLVNSSPAALDTLNELATALGNDPNFSSTMITALAGKRSTFTLILNSDISQSAGIIKSKLAPLSIVDGDVDVISVSKISGLSALLNNFAPLVAPSFVSPVNIYANSSSSIPLVLKGAVSQTADLQQWKNSSDVILSKITSDGSLYISDNVYVGLKIVNTPIYPSFTFGQGFQKVLDVGGDSNENQYGVCIKSVGFDRLPLLVKGNASQTADLQQWQSSTGSLFARIGYNGGLYLNSQPAGQFSGISFGLQDGVSYAKAIVYNHNTNQLLLGNSVSGVQIDAARMWWSVTSGDGFKINVDNGLRFEIAKFNGGNFQMICVENSVGLTIKGFAGQSSDLQQWQNSAGTQLAGVSANGEYENTTAGNGVILKSPNGTRYKVTISDTGTLTTTAA